MPYKNIEDRKAHFKIYQQSKNYKEYDWKRNGIIVLDNTFENYKVTTHCEICNIKLILGKKAKNRKCIDHDHNSGYVRNITCNTCNVKRRVVDTLKLKLHLEIHRYYFKNII